MHVWLLCLGKVAGENARKEPLSLSVIGKRSGLTAIVLISNYKLDEYSSQIPWQFLTDIQIKIFDLMLKNADVLRRKISNISDLCYSNLIVINNLTLLSFNKSLVKYSNPMYDLQ